MTVTEILTMDSVGSAKFVVDSWEETVKMHGKVFPVSLRHEDRHVVVTGNSIEEVVKASDVIIYATNMASKINSRSIH